MSSPSNRGITIFHSPFFSRHFPQADVHPEKPVRLEVCINALRGKPELQNLLTWKQPTPTTATAANQARRDQVLDIVKQVHAPSYLDFLQKTCKTSGMIGEDTYTTPDTYDVALLAASTWMQAIDEAFAHQGAFALTRPPGHHALPALHDPTYSTGFCILNNASIAAVYALTKPEVSKVSILDFDVHHGNGIEEAVNHRKNIRFVSMHQADLYPKTGGDNRCGMFNHVLNVSLPPGAGLPALRGRLEKEIVPFLFGHSPDVVIVSAGFDALETDSLGGLKFLPEDYKAIVRTLVKAAGKGVKWVFGLEGGYSVEKGGLGDAICECVMGYCLEE